MKMKWILNSLACVAIVCVGCSDRQAEEEPKTEAQEETSTLEQMGKEADAEIQKAEKAVTEAVDKTTDVVSETVDEIKAGWDSNRDEAAEAGTKMHYDIECYYNDMEVDNDSIEYTYFQQFLTDFPDLKPYRTEWTVFHEELKLAGSIDMVFEKPDGTLLIYDWKRCKEIVKTNAFGKWGQKECIEHLPDTNYWHYCLQLNTYKAILEENYGKVVEDLYLVCLHPNNKNKNYQRIKVVDLQEEVKELFELRRQEINGNT